MILSSFLDNSKRFELYDLAVAELKSLEGPFELCCLGERMH
jgi:hypothetical protein